MNSLVLTPWSHWNCNQNIFFLALVFHTQNELEINNVWALKQHLQENIGRNLRFALYYYFIQRILSPVYCLLTKHQGIPQKSSKASTPSPRQCGILHTCWIAVYLVSESRKLTNFSSTERTRCLEWRLSFTREANSSTWIFYTICVIFNHHIRNMRKKEKDVSVNPIPQFSSQKS